MKYLDAKIGQPVVVVKPIPSHGFVGMHGFVTLKHYGELFVTLPGCSPAVFALPPAYFEPKDACEQLVLNW